MPPDDQSPRAQLARILPIPAGVNLDILLTTNPAFLDLPALLQPAERVLAYCISKLNDSAQSRSKGNWLVACTDRRLIFISRGLQLEHFALDRGELVAVNESSGWFFYDVKLTTRGSIIELFQYGKPDMRRVLAALRG